MSETALLACPFCGSANAARVAGLNIGQQGYRHIYCDKDKGGCGAQGPHYGFNAMLRTGSAALAEHQAEAAWNERAQSEARRG